MTNYQPTIATIRDKMQRKGALFTSDEVQVLLGALDSTIADRDMILRDFTVAKKTTEEEF